jgi:hypothetical protein
LQRSQLVPLVPDRVVTDDPHGQRLGRYARGWAAALNFLTQGIGLVILFPLAIVSNSLVPTEHMPAVLRFTADWNPVSAVTAAARQLFGNPNPSATIHAWPMQHPVAASLLWSVALLLIFAPLATLLYRRRTTG